MTHFLLWLLISLNDLQLAEVDSNKFGGLLHILMPLLLGLALSSIYLAQPSSEFHTTMCKVLMNPSNQAIYQLDYSLMYTSLTLPATLQILSMALQNSPISCDQPPAKITRKGRIPEGASRSMTKINS
jgi:hypothetical protein